MKLTVSSQLRKQARDLAKAMHRLAHWPKSLDGAGEGLFRLPPIFLVGDDNSREQGLKNLSAMVKVLADYEEKRNTGGIRLADLPALYAKYGGNAQKAPSMRTVHNWIQQVAFALRAAELDEALGRGMAPDEAAEHVASTLFPEDGGIVFVAKASNNPNEYKPLRYATAGAKVSWLRQEAAQRQAGESYGADITPEEWAQYGIGGHFTSAYGDLMSTVNEMMKKASKHDVGGHYEAADEIDVTLANLFRSIEGLAQFNVDPETSR